MLLCPNGLLTQFIRNASLLQWFPDSILHECSSDPMVYWHNSSWMLLCPSGVMRLLWMTIVSSFLIMVFLLVSLSPTSFLPPTHWLLPPPHGLPSPQPSLLELQFSLNDATPLPPAPQPPNTSHSPCLTPSSTPCTPIRVEWYCTFSDYWKRALCCRSGIFFGFLQRSRSKIFNFNNSQGH